ncbi:hypothetical protein PBAT_05435 [Paenibacillus antarcticus]|uniref:Carotenoid biosynthesis protein n=1 Tax=Paenibacillus antarcticus TaxID=253703 RepID=A0A168QFP0_9BACL|nr:hypothetical protein PBAT_05435 [Paenibacillus antarcticus]
MVNIIFWVWYSIGAILLLFTGVPDALEFSNGLFLILYAIYAVHLTTKADFYSPAANRLFRNWKHGGLYLSIGLIWLSGVGIEMIGVQTGWPFGTYEYSDILGYRLLGVPFTLGFAWIAVVYNASLMSPTIGRYGKLVRALKVGLWTVILDLVLDPVAYHRSFWTWAEQGGFYGVPWSNYLSWFIIGALMSLCVPLFKIDLKTSRRAVRLYQMILLLFGLMGVKAGLLGIGLIAVTGMIMAEGSHRYAYRNEVNSI